MVEDYLDVYLSALPKADAEPELIEHSGRRNEILGISNDDILREKFFAWRLLEYACGEKFGKTPTELNLKREDSGRWISPYFKLSVSHCGGAVAIALSSKDVGIDIERNTEDNTPRAMNFAEKILNDRELLLFYEMPICERKIALLRFWNMKEALFKMHGRGRFIPKNCDTAGAVVLQSIRLRSGEFILSTASEILSQKNIIIKDLDNKN